MERTDVRVQVPVTVSRLRALKRLALDHDSTIAQIVRDAIEAQYGAELQRIERNTPKASANAKKRSQ